MTTINEMYLRFKGLNLPKQVPIIIEQNTDPLIEFNQSNLYNKSEDSEGEPLRFYGSNSYSFAKQKRNSRPGFGRPDLYDTGAFYKGFYARVTRTMYSINSKDSKTNKLTKKYGNNIFGLQKEEKGEYAQRFLFVGIKNYIEYQTKLKFR